MEEKKTTKETEPEKFLKEELETKAKEMDDLKIQLRNKEEILTKLGNNCFALRQNLQQIETRGESTMIMAECIRIADGNVDILLGKGAS